MESMPQDIGGEPAEGQGDVCQVRKVLQSQCFPVQGISTLGDATWGSIRFTHALMNRVVTT